MRVTIPDKVVETVEGALRGPQTVEGEITRRLQLCAHLRGGEPAMVLSAAELDQLTVALGRALTPRTFADLLAYVERRAKITFGGVDLAFSVGQLEELQRLSEREGQDLPTYLVRVAKTFTSGFFKFPPAALDTPILVQTELLEVEGRAREEAEEETGAGAPAGVPAGV